MSKLQQRSELLKLQMPELSASGTPRSLLATFQEMKVAKTTKYHMLFQKCSWHSGAEINCNTVTSASALLPRILLQREAMAIPRFAEGHVSFSCAEDVRRLRVVDSAIWLTKLGFTVVAAVVPFAFIISGSSPR